MEQNGVVMQENSLCNNGATWLELWSDALRLVLLSEQQYAFHEKFGGFFHYFEVDPELCRITANQKVYEQATLTEEQAQVLRDIIKEGFEYYELYKDRLAREQRAAAELEELKKAAIAKLTPKELKALGIELPKVIDF